jgi:uncharacterized protein
MDGSLEVYQPENQHTSSNRAPFDRGCKRGAMDHLPFKPTKSTLLQNTRETSLSMDAYQEFDREGALVKEAIYQDSVLIGPYKEYYGKHVRNHGLWSSQNQAEIGGQV